jgi:hypothetical protein
VDIVRDVLDKLVVDRNGRVMGRVDGIVLEQHNGGPPSVSAILIGPVALGFRLHPRIGRWVAALERFCGLSPARPVRIEVERIVDVAREIKTDLTRSDTATQEVEQRLRTWVAKIPGSG